MSRCRRGYCCQWRNHQDRCRIAVVKIAKVAGINHDLVSAGEEVGNRVAAGTQHKDICATAPRERVIARATHQHIDTTPTGKRVITCTAHEHISLAAAREGIVAGATVKGDGLAAAGEGTDLNACSAEGNDHIIFRKPTISAWPSPFTSANCRELRSKLPQPRLVVNSVATACRL